MISLRTALRSPLARHPRLFVRKVADRLGLRSTRIPPVPATLRSTTLPSDWLLALNEGAVHRTSVAGVAPPVTSFSRIYGQDFDEALLLRLCREGPDKGTRGLTGDIKLVWDYSRGHALWPNAINGHLDASAAFVQRWLDVAGSPTGPAWSCAMDVAIRAVNWIYADAVAEGGISRRVGSVEWAQRLWQHGAVVWQALETNLICTNHYLANLLGLAVLGSIFPADPSARRWRAFARHEFPRALLAQTRLDGGLNEASARYHAFVTEMALLTRLALNEPFPRVAEERLRRMGQIVADLRDAEGDVFALGDDDSGQVLALDWAGEVGRAGSLLRLATSATGQAFETSAEAIYPESGWWVRRAGGFVVVVEFGGVGLAGLGAHAHNDDLSLGVEWRGRPVIVDPGTYLYTSDLKARDVFRSARAHNSVVLDDLEPRVLGPGPFRLPGSDRAWPEHVPSPGTRSFDRTLRTAGSACRHRRTVRIEGAGKGEGVQIEDVVEGTDEHSIVWRFHLHPAVQARIEGSVVLLEMNGAGCLEFQPPAGLRPELESARYSAGYGREQSTLAVTAQLRTRLPYESVWSLRPRP